MPKIEGLIKLLGAIESDMLTVHQERCVSVRNRNADCLKCALACTSGALSLVDSALCVDQSKCIGCGTCATACPTCALEVKDPDDTSLLASTQAALAAASGKITLACEAALPKQAALSKNTPPLCSVRCLGRIDESLLCELAASGAQSITMAHGECSTCPHQPGEDMARAVLQSATSLLAAFGCETSIQMTSTLPAQVANDPVLPAAAGLDRREFLGNIKGASTKVVSALLADERKTGSQRATAGSARSAAYQKVGADGTLSRFIPERRQRTLTALAKIGKPQVEMVRSRVIGTIKIDQSACTSCRMCATFCPTGAIEKIDRDSIFGIVHRPNRCVQCRLCQSLCPAAALYVSDTVPIRQFVGAKALCFAMKEPAWQPNKPDSMASKIHQVIGEDIPLLAF